MDANQVQLTLLIIGFILSELLPFVDTKYKGILQGIIEFLYKDTPQIIKSISGSSATTETNVQIDKENAQPKKCEWVG